MGVSRRTFLKITGLMSAGATVGSFAGGMAANASVKDGIPSVKGKVLSNDTTKCIGCLSCAVACKEANGLPDPVKYAPITDGDTWTTVKSRQRASGEATKHFNIKVQCLHCSEPSCVAVCPTGAAVKRDDGIVVIDQDTCIGCKYCVFACPFDVPGISAETGTVQKCTFCKDRLGEGKIPACAEACPTGAIEFGDSEGILKKAGERVEYLRNNGYPNASLYGEKELGGLKVLYILPDAPGACGLPDNPKEATGDMVIKWATGILAAGCLVLGPLRTVFEVSKDENSGVKREVKTDES